MFTDQNGCQVALYERWGSADLINIFANCVVEEPIARAEVTWKGGPDLAIPLFIPSIIRTQAGNNILISDITVNLGNTSSNSSITRYYLSDTEPADPATVTVIGEAGH